MSFSTTLIAWQEQAGRHDLPWQKTQDAYYVWLSEIMLQQTQVATVVAYYKRFLQRFPDLPTLAAAPQEEVIRLWAGLGYYARARNLHRCAQEVVARYAGRFPEDPALLAELPGIGRSTAAAIAAFAYGRRAAILDGNVKRVFCRHFGIEGFPGQLAVERRLWELAEALLPVQGIKAYTQGLMDLGATVCTRSRPHCAACPMQSTCIARQDNKQALLPTPRPRKAIPEKHATFLLISDGKRLLLERRPQSGIWGGLLVPPEGEIEVTLGALGLESERVTSLPGLSHTFTHFRLHLTPLLCEVAAGQGTADGDRFCWIPLAEAADAGVPTPVRKMIRQASSALG